MGVVTCRPPEATDHQRQAADDRGDTVEQLATGGGGPCGGPRTDRCSSGTTNDTQTPVADAARSVDISAGSLTFEPDTLEISAGEDIAVTLRSTDIEHNLVIDEAGFRIAAEPDEPRDSGLRIDTPGTYTAYCSIPGHRAAGMELTLTVTD